MISYNGVFKPIFVPRVLAITESKVDAHSPVSPAQNSQASQASPFTLASVLTGVGLCLLFAALLCLWHSLDNRPPSMDEAGHILCAFNYADLFSHPHITRSAWWGKLLTVNNFYPPAVYAFNGILKVFLGPQHYVDWLSLAIYDCVLTFSVFATALILTRRTLSAAVAAVAVNLYAENIYLSHTFLLDYQVGSMVAFGVFCLVYWRESPDWKKTLLCGLALALVLATKQIAGAFLAGPGVYYFIECVRKRQPGWKVEVAQLFVMAAIAVIVMVPWAVASYGFISEFAETNRKVIASTKGAVSVPQAFVRGIRYYSFHLPYMMTPLLCCLYPIGLAVAGLKTHKRLLPVLLSSLTGLLMISLLPWQYPHHRYAAGALVAPAIYTGVLFSKAWSYRFKPFTWLPKAALAAVSLTAGLQFLSMNFYPYPLSVPQFVADLSHFLGVSKSDMSLDEKGMACPHPYEDWGQKWALEVIGKRDPKCPVWLNVMANHVEYNPHTFTLQGKAIGSVVKPTSSRTWTVLGDTVNYSEESCLYYQWYLIKTGDVSSHKGDRFLLNKESEIANDNILNFVRNSGKFELIAKRKVPDGSEIMLYRQK